MLIWKPSCVLQHMQCSASRETSKVGGSSGSKGPAATGWSGQACLYFCRAEPCCSTRLAVRAGLAWAKSGMRGVPALQMLPPCTRPEEVRPAHSSVQTILHRSLTCCLGPWRCQQLVRCLKPTCMPAASSDWQFVIPALKHVACWESSVITGRVSLEDTCQSEMQCA